MDSFLLTRLYMYKKHRKKMFPKKKKKDVPEHSRSATSITQIMKNYTHTTTRINQNITNEK